MATFSDVLQTLARQRGVNAAIIVSEADGIVVESHAHIGLSHDRVAALAAALYRKARLSAQAAGLGTAAFMQLEAPRGRICAIGADDLLLVVVAASTINVGLVRVAMRNSVSAIRELGGAGTP